MRPAAFSLLHRAAPWLGACAVFSAAPAGADDVVTLSGLGRVQARLELQAWPAAPSERGTHFEAPAGEIDARVWLGSGGRPFGVGFGAVASEAAPHGARSTTLMLGLRYDFGNGSRLTFGSSAGSSSPGFGAERDLRLGLDLKPARNAKRYWRGTLFRTQLTQDTQLSLRVKSRGLRLVLRSEF